MKAKDKYIAFDASIYEFQMFETLNEAKEWLLELTKDDGIPEEFINGQCCIAKITHKSKFTKTDCKDNYRCEKNPDKLAECSYCENGCGGEEWSHNSDYDFVGDCEFKEVT